jgi:peptide/nickel transport system substrate-binding protein
MAKPAARAGTEEAMYPSRHKGHGKWMGRALLHNIALAALVVAALATSSTAGATAAVQLANTQASGTVTFADQPGAQTTYIFPFAPGSETSVSNFQTIYMLWRPLYWFGVGTQAKVDTKLSLADLPVLSNAGKTVTIKLKSYRWSDGQPVTSRDILFWWNILEANKADFGNYQPGQIPDDVVSYSAPNPSTFVLNFNQAFSLNWTLYNQLSLIIPMPQHAWDKTSASSPVGNYDETTAGAKAVYGYLNGQADEPASYGTNPLWKVVDGPWHLQSFASSTGEASFVPNSAYAGPYKPSIGKFVMLPFTTDTAEFDALRAGEVDYGYLPVQDLSQAKYLKSKGFEIDPWVAYGTTWMWLNYGNSTASPIFHQLYFRQALQHLINEPQYIKDVFHGYAVPTYGPVPVTPKNQWASKQESTNPYPYDVKQAKQLLASHGWSVPAGGGAARCTRPGSSSSECGAGVAMDQTLNFSLIYPSGQLALGNEMEAIQSSFSQAGVHLVLHQEPANYVFANVNICKPSTKVDCGWQIGLWGSPSIFYTPDNEPTGDPIFTTGGAFNAGSYSNSVNDANVAKTHFQGGLQPMYKYENYLAKQLPGIWLPSSPYQISVITKKVKGASEQSVYVGFTPEQWKLG